MKKKIIPKKVLVTGGAGYIGAILTEKLAKNNLDVRVLDKFYFGKEPVAHLDGKVEFVEGDIRTPPKNLFDGVDTVIHLAGLSNDPTAEFNPQANHEINTVATERLAKKAKDNGVKRFIFASSCSIYDLGLENESGIKDENAKVKPQAAYSTSKYKAERALKKLADKGFCVIILRKGTVFGFSPRLRYDLVLNTMVKNALSTGIIKVFCRGLQWRPLVDVEDAARAYYKALVAPAEKVNGHIFNISLDNFLIKDLAELTRKTLKKHFRLNTKIIFEQNEKKDRSYRVSNRKAKEILRFVPKISVEESIMKLVENIRQRGHSNFEHPIYYNIKWMRPIFEKELSPPSPKK